jgi:tetratricopeptide (TPR) repeat protein
MTMPFDDEPYSKWSITYWTASVVFFWKDWWGSRRGGMWYFIGVCAAVGVLLVLFFIVPKAMHESTRRAYERRWIQAQNQEKWTEADLWLRRLLAMGDKRPVVRYQHALVVEKLGRTALAEAKMRELAAERDFPAALAWLAARSLDANATPEKIQNAIQHLEAAVQLNGDDEKLRVGLADAYTRAGRLKDAANQLLSVAKKRPQYNLHLARLYAERRSPRSISSTSRSKIRKTRTSSSRSPTP